jgi:hypothetical protein
MESATKFGFEEGMKLKTTDKTSKSDYITKRIAALSGKTVDVALSGFTYEVKGGKSKDYKLADLKYDIQCGYLEDPRPDGAPAKPSKKKAAAKRKGRGAGAQNAEKKTKTEEAVHVPEIKANSLLTVKPNIAPPLDPDFRPYILGSKKYMENATEEAGCEDFHVAVVRHAGLTSRFTVPCFPETHANFDDSCIYIERRIKFILWQKGGYKLYVSGNPTVCTYLTTTYSPGGDRKFDVDLMEQAYNESFETHVVTKAKMPKAKENSLDLGGNLDGNRIGFDLGGSDFKLAAIKDGKAIYTTEIP